ncbi:MAG: NAD(P)-dependent oxidoreductase [Armatimonadota bacterium]|nr:NAD(P)-dependent oxidoreductase [Armatimonadota bacterium]
MAKVAFFGLGLMGEPMAGHLIAGGHEVVVVAHRRRDPVERLVARGAREAATPQAAAAQTEVAITVLPTAAEVEETLFGPAGLAAAMRQGYVVVDMGTSYPPDTRRIGARVEAAGGRMVDAPITGGPSGAQAATLTIMVGGDPTAVEVVRPLLELMGKTIVYFGGLGAGHTAKLVQNLIGIVTSAAICEGFALAARAGLDLGALFQMLSASTSNSPQLQHVVSKVFARDFDRVGFRLDLSFKDIKQATALGRELGVPLLASNGAAELMQLARAAGYGNQDSTAMVRGLERLLGIEIRGERGPAAP